MGCGSSTEAAPSITGRTGEPTGHAAPRGPNTGEKVRDLDADLGPGKRVRFVGKGDDVEEEEEEVDGIEEEKPLVKDDELPRKPRVPPGLVEEEVVVRADKPELTTLNQKKVVMSRVTTNLDSRKKGRPQTPATAPGVRPGELWNDPDFPERVATKGIEDQVEWKRPGDFCGDPQLFTDGTTRFDIQQGGAGTCWFLSILACLADKPEVLHQVIPEGAYTIGQEGYDGVFHCRFWNFGEWVDVYVDDHIPVRPWGDGFKPWGAESKDPDEMWVSLMEKAFAKLHGSYTGAYGGWAGDAFISLTGGVAEQVEMDKTSPKELFSRVKNSLASGAVVACSVPSEKDGAKGLVGGHAYSLSGTAKVPLGGKTVPLLRVRNPWGSEKGEWLGPWADNTAEWDQAGDKIKQQLEVSGRGDGEFWISLEDYTDYFRDTHICNFTPDFDKDGIEEGLDQVCCIMGEWAGPSAAGSDASVKFNNPKYLLQVPDKAQGLTPVVIQIIQARKNRKDNDYCYLRTELYKVDAGYDFKGTRQVALDERTNYTTYFGGASLSYRYQLEPGDYVILPTTMDAKKEKEFCLRTFSAKELSCKVWADSGAVFVRRSADSFEHKKVLYQTPKFTHHFGQWIKGKNAGGQISNDTCTKNPQYLITIPGGSPQPVTIALLQENVKPKQALGYVLVKVDSVSNVPMSKNYLWKHYQESIKTIEGSTVFVMSFEAEGHHLLDHGIYVCLLFLDKAGVEKRYCLALGSKDDLPEVREFYMA